MFATRFNQENNVHPPQQNTKSGLAPKTPGKNNENALHLPGKTNGGKADRGNVFITPANPRTRAPLGNKTTNAKALQPAPTTTINKPSSGKTRRAHPKIKVHASTTPSNDNVLQQEEEREIEYMPPRETPMPDHGLDEEIFPRDRDLSCLQGRNLTRGWWAEVAPEGKDDEGELSDFGEKLRKAERERKRIATAKVGSVRARGAVGALASKPTAALRGGERKPLAKSTVSRGVAPAANPRFTAAKVASNSTIGYSKGRVVSRPKVGSAFVEKKVEKKTALEDLLQGFGDLGIDDAEADSLGLGGGGNGEVLGEEEDSEVFQLESLGEDVGV